MTLCLFGGAFNPPHRTHQRVIAAALAQLPVQRLVVLPTGQHPLKPDDDLAPAEARVELCRIAFADQAGVEVDDWETRQPRPSYTVETVQHFREYATGGERPYWIIGADNLTILSSWHRWRELVELAVLVTCPRMGYAIDDTGLAEIGLGTAQREEILAHVLQVEPDDVSASEIRARIRRGEPTDTLLDPAVAQRIDQLGLYREAR